MALYKTSKTLSIFIILKVSTIVYSIEILHKNFKSS